MSEVTDKILSYFKVKDVRIENDVFRTMTKGSVMICLVGSVLCAATQYFGDPIVCDFGQADVNGDLAKQHCWIHGSNWIDPRYQEDFDCVVNHGECYQYIHSSIYET